MTFPQSFVWGSATASYQIEGGHDADGKGPSVWDMMAHWPGKIVNDDHGDVACDHYHRYTEDVQIMKNMGLQAYRFSLSWPRIMPDGTGKVNEAGIAFYDRLIDELLGAGVQPWITLFHWDYPLALFQQGGWLNAASPEWFADYTKIVIDRFSDRVTNWMTLNEPQCFIGLGHHDGMHAPGLQLPVEQVLRAWHHALMAHGRAVQVIHEHAKQSPTVSWAPVGVAYYPAEETPENIEAARCASMNYFEDKSPVWSNTWGSDPVIKGHYPEAGMKKFGHMMKWFKDSDFEIIKQPLDFYGVNIYQGHPIVADDQSPKGFRDVKREQGFAQTQFYWPHDPKSMYWICKTLYDHYNIPIVITENGTSMHDWVDEDGTVNDAQRIIFLRDYMRELGRAIDDGADVRGYFLWSLMDNFEWAEGYRQRFGLVHVDYQTLKRTPKASSYWYKQVIESNGAVLRDAQVVK
ncbi:GH1 family beta-glucosidase [Poriferisphaera sp. WC338]|uniref:GH1 family beta-glucosidase n=1 Tax=Poriferisphaera sp. WC338 TaxID=3425129 RepID=UPI003D8186D0